MRKALSEIVGDVATRIGLPLIPECEDAEGPVPGLSGRVRLLAPELLRRLLLETETDCVREVGNLPTSGFGINENGTGILPLPEDFLRLVAVKISGWSREVTEICHRGSPEAAFSHSQWKGIRGNPERPKVFLGRTRDGVSCLELFSCGKDESPEYALYIAEPSFRGDMIDIPERLYPELIERIAGRLLPGESGN